MSQTMSSPTAREKLPLGGGYHACAPAPGATGVWSLRKDDGGLIGYFLTESDAKAFAAARTFVTAPPPEDAGEGPVVPQDHDSTANEAKLAAARHRIRWLSQQFQAAFASALGEPATLLDRTEVAEAINKARCLENGLFHRPLAWSAGYERDYCLRLADAVLAIGSPPTAREAA